MDWRRVLEGIVVAALLIVALITFGSPAQTLAILGRVNLVLFTLSLATTLGGILVWSLALSVLLQAQTHEMRLGRFQVVFVAGMGLRSLIPGGSTSGPLVLAYLVTRTTDVPGETSVAMAYVLEVFLWIGTTVVGFVGFAGLLAFGHPSPQVIQVAVGLLALTVVIFAVIVYAVRNPEPIEWGVDTVVHWLKGHAGKRSSGIVGRLDPEVIDERIERFVDAFRRLAEDPTHLGPALLAAVVGWFVHASTLFLIFGAVGVHVGVFASLAIVSVSGLAEGLSIFPGGIGVVEPTFLAFLLLVTPIGVPTAATVVILYRLSNYWFRVAVGFLSLPVLGIGDVLHASVTES
ncbi:MAG: YbhN family protein [Halanaeroarchaeum sp.]